MKKPLAVALAAPLLFLAACEEEAPDADTGATGGEAAGEVLGGTISDDMIALEELTSTSPPAERPAPERGSDGTAPASTTPEATEATDAEAQEAEAPAEVSAEAPAPEPVETQ